MPYLDLLAFYTQCYVSYCSTEMITEPLRSAEDLDKYCKDSYATWNVKLCLLDKGLTEY